MTSLVLIVKSGQAASAAAQNRRRPVCGKPLRGPILQSDSGMMLPHVTRCGLLCNTPAGRITPWNCSSLTKERVVALVIAAAQVIAAVAFAKVSSNRGILAASALGLTLPGLLLIWFREGLSATAFDRGVMRRIAAVSGRPVRLAVSDRPSGNFPVLAASLRAVLKGSAAGHGQNRQPTNQPHNDHDRTDGNVSADRRRASGIRGLLTLRIDRTLR